LLLLVLADGGCDGTGCCVLCCAPWAYSHDRFTLPLDAFTEVWER